MSANLDAGKVPQVTTPIGYFTDENGKQFSVRVDIVFWRFFARVAAQISGSDPNIIPPDPGAILSITEAQAKPQIPSIAAIQEAALQLIGMIPKVQRDLETAQDARIALAMRPPVVRDNGALDLATLALLPRPQTHGTEALDTAMIALSRVSPRAPVQQGQIFVCTQATFPALSTLPPNSFIYVADFAHLIYYDGTVTSFADAGSNYYAFGSAAPGSIGWHAVDGSTVSYLNADGTLTVKTLVDNVATPAVLQAGSGADTLNAPVAPGFTGALAGGSVNSGTGSSVGIITGIGTLAVDTTGLPETFYSKLWFRL